MTPPVIVVDATVLFGAMLRGTDRFRVRFWLESAEDVKAPESVRLQLANAVRESVRRNLVSTARGLELLSKMTLLVNEYVPIRTLLRDSISESLKYRTSVSSMLPIMLARRIDAGFFSLLRERTDIAASMGLMTLW